MKKTSDIIAKCDSDHDTCNDETCAICIEREREAARALQSPSMHSVFDRLRQIAVKRRKRPQA